MNKEELEKWLSQHKEPDADNCDDYWREYWQNYGLYNGLIRATEVPKKGGAK